jgi:hypothetical protein
MSILYLLRRYFRYYGVTTKCGAFVVTIIPGMEMPPVNEDYEPTEIDEAVLEVLKEGRANPLHIREKADLPKQRVNESLERLRSHRTLLTPR